MTSSALFTSQTISNTLPLGMPQMSWCESCLSLWNLKSQTSSPSQVNFWTRPPWPLPPKSCSAGSSLAARSKCPFSSRYADCPAKYRLSHVLTTRPCKSSR